MEEHYRGGSPLSKETRTATPIAPVGTDTSSRAKKSAAPADGSDARTILARAVVIVTASGESPALLDEVIALEANLASEHVSDDIAILLLESALYQHLPDLLSDQRDWVRELARLAGV